MRHLDHGIALLGWFAICISLLCGCGTTKMRTATEQLLMSDAVDRSVAHIDFRPLAGKKVFFDDAFVRPVKGFGFVNSDYIISSLRQQIVSAGCLLQEARDDADIIIEARVGTLGADGYSVSYGLPASNALSTAASLLPETPPVPAIPEISIGRRESSKASAKIAAFAYDRKTRQAIWQSGIAQSETDARDTWVLGIGPFESGTVREHTRLAGKSIPFNADDEDSPQHSIRHQRPAVDYTAELEFRDGYPITPGSEQELAENKSGEGTDGETNDKDVQQASFDESEEKKTE